VIEREIFSFINGGSHFELASLHTAGFMKTVPLVYTVFIKTIYLSHSTQVPEETVFSKHLDQTCAFTIGAIMTLTKIATEPQL